MNKIKEYTSSSKKSLILKFLKNLNKKGQLDHTKKIIKTIEKLEENKLSLLLKIKLVKKLKGQKNIFELIIKWQDANYRIFFSIINGDYYLTNIFNKKSKKTPRNEIKIAKNRLKKLINN